MITIISCLAVSFLINIFLVDHDGLRTFLWGVFGMWLIFIVIAAATKWSVIQLT